MTQDELIKIIEMYRDGEIYMDSVLTAVEAYSSASNNGKPLVSGSLPCSLCNGTGRQIPYHDVAKYYEDDGNDH